MMFGPGEIDHTRNAFQAAEKLAGRYFGLPSGAWKDHRYDVKTLAHLRDHEVNETVFAQLCKYEYGTAKVPDSAAGLHFYRICLQDNRILDAIRRGTSFIRFGPLMLYIAAHELIHIVRFDRGQCSFDMPVEERRREEERVHGITRQVLKPASSSELDLVLECFSDDYLIEGMSN
ncbi:MAG: hypothetical protein AB1640_13460 [bacterium]